MNWLNKITQKKNKVLPKIGELWQLIDKSPWPKEWPPITILDVKDNWVRYDNGPIFTDQRLKLSLFLHCYNLYKKK